MHKPQLQVRQLHEEVVFMPTSPAEPMIRNGELRAALMMEEPFETLCALVGTSKAVAIALEQIASVLKKREGLVDGDKPNLEEAIDGCIDTLVVTYGTLEDMGVDAEPFFDEVHNANMRKKDGPVRADGKRLKPPGWVGPDIKGVLNKIRASRR
jgi:predicted HAD superfamily Cof-like phosphohydrolase